MLGLGESYDEVIQTLRDLRDHDVDIVTLGQYMRPTKKHLAVKEWVHPDVFKKLGDCAREMGFLSVASAPLVRSSYKANLVYKQLLGSSHLT
jgi:lipoic acid synthetase